MATKGKSENQSAPKKSAPKKGGAKKSGGSKKSESPKNADKYEAIQEFHDYAESEDGSGYKTYGVGTDVSHLPQSKLDQLVDANLVKKVEPQSDQNK